jgi:hypothetical protein
VIGEQVAIFTTAMLVAFATPRLGFGPICSAAAHIARDDTTERIGSTRLTKVASVR